MDLLAGMSNDMPSTRRDAILSRLKAGQPVRSGALAEEFGLSEDAIRRDLRSLAAEGLCRRVYGGALPMVDGAEPMEVRAREGSDRKQALARAAMDFIDAGTLVFIDNGSTNLELAKLLPPNLGLTVATNSISIAAALERRDDVDLLVVGGAIDRLVGGAVGADAVSAAAALNVDTCILGACALSSDGGASAFVGADAAFKRTLVQRSGRTFVMATNDKLGRRAPHRVVDVDALTAVVVEYDAKPQAVRDLADAGASMVRADPPAVADRTIVQERR
jgi:DeoR/GlpR family transcriptional regulator of sugar metabolism